LSFIWWTLFRSAVVITHARAGMCFPNSNVATIAKVRTGVGDGRIAPL